MLKKQIRTLMAAGISAAVLLASQNAFAQSQVQLRAHTGSPGSSAFTFSTTMQSVIQRNLPYRVNMTVGQTSTRSTLDAARGQVDLYISAPAINHYMKTGTAMFANMSNAPELFEKVRAVLNFPLGPYHVITYEDTGIKSLYDIRGKRVFLGPPGGAATLVALAIVEGATGYKPGRDFEQARMDWASGNQAFQDRQVDLAILPTELPSASISQYALLGRIRLIGLPDESFETEAMKSVLSVPGRTIEEIPPGIYGRNQVNTEPVKAVGSWVGIGTHVGVSEEVIYNITKAIFENINVFHEAAEFMKAITLETALREVNAPLHIGALRYYREAGVEVPDHLIPPEARE